MPPDDEIEDRDDIPTYREPGEINGFELSEALCSLHLLGDDPFLRIQSFNLSLVDHFIMDLECGLAKRRFDEEEISFVETGFLSAQTQMWIFAAYEVLRTWRQRAKSVALLARNGGLQLKIDALDRDLPFLHAGRKMRADQLRRVMNDPSIIDRIEIDVRRTHFLFTDLEHVRIALAKHEVSGRKNSVAYSPGYGRYNMWNGSLEYELSNEGVILGTLNRRDIAERLRALSDASSPPSDEDIASYNEFMKATPPPELM